MVFNKKLLLVILSLTLSILCLVPVSAETTNFSYTSTGYSAVIEDDYNLLSSSDFDKVMDAMKPMLEYGNVAFVTCSKGGSAVTEADNYGYSHFGGSSYFVFLIDMSSRDLGVYVNGRFADLISLGRCNTIADNVYKHASYGQYAECAIKAFKQGYSYASNNASAVATPMKTVSNVFLALVFSLLLNYALVKILHGNRKMSSVKQAEFAGSYVRFNDCDTVLMHVDKKYSPQSKGGSGGGGHGGGGGGHGGGHHF